MNTSVIFRPFQPSDRDTVLALMREYYSYDHLDFDPARASAGLALLLHDPSNGALWLISSGGEVAGYCVLGAAFSLEFHGRTAFLDELYLREPWRGRGLGRQVLDFLMQECRARGLHALRLEVEEENHRARHLYEQAGFRRHSRSIMTKWLGDQE